MGANASCNGEKSIAVDDTNKPMSKEDKNDTNEVTANDTYGECKAEKSVNVKASNGIGGLKGSSFGKGLMNNAKAQMEAKVKEEATKMANEKINEVTGVDVEALKGDMEGVTESVNMTKGLMGGMKGMKGKDFGKGLMSNAKAQMEAKVKEEATKMVNDKINEVTGVDVDALQGDIEGVNEGVNMAKGLMGGMKGMKGKDIGKGLMNNVKGQIEEKAKEEATKMINEKINEVTGVDVEALKGDIEGVNESVNMAKGLMGGMKGKSIGKGLMGNVKGQIEDKVKEEAEM